MTISKLKADGLDIMNCRGHAYDNTATMAECHTGVQQRIKDINPNAEFVSCSNHSLNLVCVHAPSVETVLEAKREEFVDDALIYVKSLCEELEISFEPPKTNQEAHIWRRKLDYQDHKIPSTSVDEEINFETSHPENENKIKSKPNKKKLSKKSKNKAKESTEEFIFPKKTARPISTTQDPTETNNHFSDLEQDVEHPLPTE
ncbi:uncharacterized protein TNCV_3594461 [Trichonephila clavipes]|nr:uncharacterized protein TNCV_3594461 [Trichonephila clavipes]